MPDRDRPRPSPAVVLAAVASFLATTAVAYALRPAFHGLSLSFYIPWVVAMTWAWGPLAGGAAAMATVAAGLAMIGRPPGTTLPPEYEYVRHFVFGAVELSIVWAVDAARARARRERERYELLAEEVVRLRAHDALLDGWERVLPAIVWRADAAGRVVAMSPKWGEMTGQAVADSAGRGWVGRLHRDDRGRVLEEWAAAVADPDWTSFECQFRLEARDGSFRWMQSRAVRAGDGWLGLLTDIDRQKRNEQDLRDAIQSRAELIARVSHELRTPLTPVLLIVTGLLEDPHRTALIRDELEVVATNLRLHAQLVGDLLDMEDGHRVGELVPLDLHELIRTTIHTQRAVGEARRHTLAFDPRCPEHWVRGDATRLIQVFINVLTNAMKYTDPGGRIVVRTRCPSPGRIRVEVEDDGVGILAGDLVRLFQPFRRGHAASRGEPGMGLGLSIAQALVDRHGGHIQALSAGRDRGTTIRIEFDTVPEPAAAPPALEPTPAPINGAGTAAVAAAALTPLPEAAPPAGLRILLAEDNVPSLTAFATALARRGHVVLTAANYRTAMTMADRETYDVLVSDIDLGDGSGLELMRYVARTRGVPGLSVSGWASQSDFEQSADAGFAVHLTKPVSLGELLEAVVRVVEEARAVVP